VNKVVGTKEGKKWKFMEKANDQISLKCELFNLSYSLSGSEWEFGPILGTTLMYAKNMES